MEATLFIYLFFYFYFFDTEYHSAPRLECSGVILITATSASPVAGIKGPCYHTQLIFVFLVEMGLHHVGQAYLELLTW